MCSFVEFSTRHQFFTGPGELRDKSALPRYLRGRFSSAVGEILLRRPLPTRRQPRESRPRDDQRRRRPIQKEDQQDRIGGRKNDSGREFVERKSQGHIGTDLEGGLVNKHCVATRWGNRTAGLHKSMSSSPGLNNGPNGPVPGSWEPIVLAASPGYGKPQYK